jgi:transcriptional regulator with XRE-family HTH domain
MNATGVHGMTEVRGNPERRWSPTVRRQRLAGVLAGLRSRDGRSAAEIADALGVHKSTVTRLEDVRHLALPKINVIERLLAIYGADDETRDRVRVLVSEARQRDWWQTYKPYLPPASATYLGLEAETAVQLLWQPTLLPGIIQTRAYGQAILAEQLPALPDDQVTAFAAERYEAEQHLVHGADPVHLRIVLGEAALHNEVGGPQVMAEQLDYLHQIVQLPHVTFFLAPFARGTHGGLAPFTVLRFPEPTDPELAYLPDPLGGRLVRDRRDVDQLVRVFQELTLLQPDRDLNLRLISEAAERFRGKAKG